MEWLILGLLLGLPLIRFVLLPVRVAGRMRRLPIGRLAIILAIVTAGWMALQAVSSPTQSTGRYARGDAQMRDLLK